MTRARGAAAGAPATESILGFPVSTEGLDELAGRALAWIAGNERGRYFVCANPHSLEAARRDARFAQALREADFVLPDGVGIVLASRLLGGVIRRRITGTDLFMALNARLEALGGRRCFFLGSSAENLARLGRRMAEVFPGVEVAGWHAPPFREVFDAAEEARMIEAVNAARPDVLWIGMTAPKQELWAHAHRRELEAGLLAPVGAVFDFFSGAVPRSHPWFRQHGLEWLPRLLREPRRLWRRNLVSTPAFVARVLRRRWAGAGGQGGGAGRGC